METFSLLETTIAELQALQAAGQLTAQDITQLYLDRIAQLDSGPTAVNAVIELNPEALDIAAALDAERHTAGTRGPLHGIPILLKDNIDTADAMQTTAGSLALAGTHAPHDAFLVAQLRAAGAVILGKTNLSEWANFRSTHSSSGWSSRGGQTRNPYALDRSPCGSSSGSGAAVSANFCTAAIGTETDGSIVCPAHANGIVGLKPTLGLVSRSGIIPIAHSQDTAGPMTRTVADAAILLGALAGVDARDPATAVSQVHLHTDYTQFLDPQGLRGARIGILRDYVGKTPAVDAIMETAVDTLRRLGAVIVDPVALANRDAYRDTELEVLLYEFKSDLAAYFATLGPDFPIRSLADVIAFNHSHAHETMPWFGQELLEMAATRGPLTDEAYLQALANNRRQSRTAGIDALLQEHALDAILSPTGNPAWPIDWVNGDASGWGSSAAAAVAGYPNITVPAGFVHGLPVGVSFFAGAWSEPTLLRLAYAFELATQARRPPAFLPTLTFKGPESPSQA